ncbi:MAG: endonuclease dU [Promethearchaeota archaeon]
MIRSIKEGIQVVGIDDAVHQRGDETTELIFTFCKGTFLEYFRHATIDVDGLNGTDVIIDTLEPVKNRFRIIVTHGITIGGLNLIDIDRIHDVLEKPIIAVTENTPSGDSLLEAISHLPGADKRKKIVTRAGDMFPAKTRMGKNALYFHVKGMSVDLAKIYLKKFSVRSRLPECVLLAHVIGSGI